MKNLKRGYLQTAFVVSYVVAVVCVVWLFKETEYKSLIASITAITALAASAVALVEHFSSTTASGLSGSPLTPNSPILKKLMEGAVEAVCRGVSVPQTPETAALSAFIFKLENKELVCTHYWAPNPRKEQVGILRFALSDELAKRVAVVRSAINKEPCRTSVSPLPATSQGISGEVDEINFVLAAPILNEDRSIWGVVDLDSSNEVGKALLMNSVSDSVMHNLSSHIRLLFSLAEPK